MATRDISLHCATSLTHLLLCITEAFSSHFKWKDYYKSNHKNYQLGDGKELLATFETQARQWRIIPILAVFILPIAFQTATKKVICILSVHSATEELLAYGIIIWYHNNLNIPADKWDSLLICKAVQITHG